MRREAHSGRNESRESEERRAVEVTEASFASRKHKDRNEDAALGDTARIDAETAASLEFGKADLMDRRPELKRLISRHSAKVQESGRQERQAAGRLRELGVHGVFDGVSGAESGVGAGAVASRIAAGTIAERLAGMANDAGIDATKDAIKDAMIAAHAEVSAYKNADPEFAKDLKQMATTADILRTIDNGDGTHEVVYGHTGDSRIYMLDGATGELRQVTTDDSLMNFLVENKRISAKQAETIMRTDKDRLDDLQAEMPKFDPDFLKLVVDNRQGVVSSIGAEQMSPHVGSFRVKKGDKVLISSDGIHDNVPDEMIATILNGGGAEELAKLAYARAGGNGTERTVGAKGPDDITLKVLEFGESRREDAPSTVMPDIAMMERDIMNARSVAARAANSGSDAEHYRALMDLYELLSAKMNAEGDGAVKELRAVSTEMRQVRENMERRQGERDASDIARAQEGLAGIDERNERGAVPPTPPSMRKRPPLAPSARRQPPTPPSMRKMRVLGEALPPIPPPEPKKPTILKRLFGG